MKSWVSQCCCLLGIVILCLTFLDAQTSQTPTQETINKRVAEIIDNALKQATFTTPEGVSVAERPTVSLAESEEIKSFGKRAIAPLRPYLDSPEPMTQHLVVNLLGDMGGKNVIEPLTYAAEHSESPLVRSTAIINLGLQPWKDVGEIIQRISQNDPDPSVRDEARKLAVKHHAVSPNSP